MNPDGPAESPADASDDVFLPDDFEGGVGPTGDRDWAGILPPEKGAPNYGPLRWLATLLLRPSSFFARYGSIEANSFWLWIAIWGVSVVMLADKFETRVISGRWTVIPPDWAVYWGMLLLMSAVGTLGAMLFRGWFFRLRLLFCGIRGGAAYWRGMRIWTFASLISAVPLMALLVVETAYFDTPTDMLWNEMPGEALWIWAFLVLPVWSVIASYRGVRAVFPEAGKWSVRIWFAIAPFGMAVVGLLVIAAMAFAAGFPEPPDLTRPGQMKSRAFAFEFPGNWALDATWEGYDPDRLVFFATPQGGSVSLMLVPRVSDVPAHIAERREELVEYGVELSPPVPLRSMAGRTGIGEQSGFTELMVPWVHEVFVTELSEFASLEIEVLKPKASSKDTDQGVEFIVESLRVTSPDMGPVDLLDPAYTSSERWALNSPRDWFVMSTEPEFLALEAWRPAEFSVQIYRSDLAVEDELFATLSRHIGKPPRTPIERFTSWAGLEGTGLIARGVPVSPVEAPDGAAAPDVSPEASPEASPDASDAVEIRVFIHELPTGELLEFHSRVRVIDRAEIEPGFALIEGSFTLKPMAAPDSDG